MLQIIVGEKGRGKTKIMLDKVSADVNNVKGSIIYIDKDDKHMFGLDNKIRLINMSEFELEDSMEFTGFICGIISQNHDIEKFYLDSFLKIAKTDKKEICEVIERLEYISAKFEKDFVISVSMNEEELPDNAKKYVTVSL